MTHKKRKELIGSSEPNISISRQAELIGISRASYYYQPMINPYKKEIMDLIDEIYTECPFFGNRKIQYVLKRDHNKIVGRGLIRSLMRLMGIEAIYPKPKLNLSQRRKEHKIYPYLLKGLKIVRPNQVWSEDITYIKLKDGWVYLVAVLDWYSRYVISWRISITLEIDFCIEAIDEALKIAVPEINNSDQGSHFTSPHFLNPLQERNVRISMDGKGRYLDNIFVERLWRTVKYEDVYLKDYQTPEEVQKGFEKYFDFYNNKRPHQALEYKTPAEIYWSDQEKKRRTRMD